ncbi:lipoprotein releasing system, ATP-binding protein [Catenovulum agarivorans DS-2]|uniref:Lipoprotein-releasing system ATP-binding protein LolD n=1 Tax=Catenovulum agarivorans DS-2 TaxID=1328313 RepID=W7R1A8_9ALTE|nr:lipoprotein-releasing ABC transporter ATP-binding protein LolD [Catenovulum agarivorans]EWH11410.1 lipoprotein releasing system, ATP-binding protein [Catenovulum agarivorans DS-2]
MSNSQVIMQCTNVTKTYQDGDNQVNVLKGVNLTVNRAEHVAIVGSSGSGKSTLLHIMGVLDQPTSGVVTFEQTNIHQLSADAQAEFRNQSLGFVYQFHHLLAEFNALENVAMPLLIAGNKRATALKKAQQTLDLVGLSHRTKHFPSALSGGERQRVAIARAIVNQPKIVLADEPTGNLDAENAQSIFKLIDDLKQNLATSFVFVTHDLSLASRMDKQFRLVKGEIQSGLEITNV